MTLTPKTLTFKRGDSFELVFQVRLINGDSLAGLTAAAQARRASSDALLADLDVDVRPVSANEVLVIASKPYTDTQTWPLGTLKLDLELTWGDLRVSTPTLKIQVQEDVTRHA